MSPPEGREGIWFRYKDLEVDTYMDIIIKDIEQNDFYANVFIRFDAWLVVPNGLKDISILIPKYQFRKEYLKFSVRKRTHIGRYDVFMRVMRLKYGRFKILEMRRWEDESSEKDT